MEDWKITLSEGILSYSKMGKKKVQIKCADNATGKQVAQAVTVGVQSYPLSTDFKKIEKGISYKDFAVVTGSWQAQEEFIERLERVLREVNDYKNKLTPAATGTSDADPKDLQDTKKKNRLLIFAAIVIVAVIVWALWK